MKKIHGIVVTGRRQIYWIAKYDEWGLTVVSRRLAYVGGKISEGANIAAFENGMEGIAAGLESGSLHTCPPMEAYYRERTESVVKEMISGAEGKWEF